MIPLLITAQNRKPSSDGDPHYTGPDTPMPDGYRMLAGFITLLIFVLTGAVWLMAFDVRGQVQSGAWVPIEAFNRIFLGYHILMLIVSISGWAMQTYWRKYESLGLFPAALSVGTLSLIVAAGQMFLLMLL